MQWFWSRLDIYAVILKTVVHFHWRKVFNEIKNKKVIFSFERNIFKSRYFLKSVKLEIDIVLKFSWAFQVKTIENNCFISFEESKIILQILKYFEHFKEKVLTWKYNFSFFSFTEKDSTSGEHPWSKERENFKVRRLDGLKRVKLEDPPQG